MSEPDYDPDDVRDLAELAKLEAAQAIMTDTCAICGSPIVGDSCPRCQRTPGAVTLSPNSFAELEAVLRERDALREEIERVRAENKRALDNLLWLARVAQENALERYAKLKAQRDALADALLPVYSEYACSHRYLGERGIPIPKERTAWLSAAETALRGAGRLQKEES